MKSFYAILWLSCVAQTAAQQTEAPDEAHIYNVAMIEVKPEFPGGLPAFYQYVASNYKVPASLKTEGRVIASFVIEKDGTLDDIRVLRDAGEATAAETIRVLSASPKWTPAKLNGTTVRCLFTLPLDLKPYPAPSGGTTKREASETK